MKSYYSLRGKLATVLLFMLNDVMPEKQHVVLFLASHKYRMKSVTLKSIIKFNQNNTYTGVSIKGYGHTCFAKKDFDPREVVMMSIGKVINHQTPIISIQIGVDKHFQPTKWAGRYWNHSCDPNTYVKMRADGFPNLVALRRIKRGDEITYSYAMTEYSWCKNAEERTTLCKCNDKKCKGTISSFSQLPKSEQKVLVENRKCAPYLKKLL